MTLREAAQQALDAKQVPLRELLASVPADARLLIDDADGKGTRSIPVGRLCQEAAAALAEPCSHGECFGGECIYTPQSQRPAEPVQEPEPVAWRYKDARGNYLYCGYVQGFDKEHPLLKPVPLYAAPPQRKPLVDPAEYDDFGAAERYNRGLK